MKTLLWVAVWTGLSWGPPDQPPDSFYQPWAAVLQGHVAEGGVDYRGLHSSRHDLDRFVDQLASVSKKSYLSWSREAQIAFWINVYNALTLRIIIDHYPIRGGLFRSLIYPSNSIQQIAGVWDEIRFPVMDRRLSLNQIEHEILRTEFSEPRIHFALVCASRGCPPLLNRPYRGDDLDRSLSRQTEIFLASPRNFRIDGKRGQIYLSSIFKWFGEDFPAPGTSSAARDSFPEKSPVERGILHFLTPYLSPEEREFLHQGRYRIRYVDYDWHLNETAQP